MSNETLVAWIDKWGTAAVVVVCGVGFITYVLPTMLGLFARVNEALTLLQ